tara:strand:+ start:696 stop:824 length:129 start_codon:yes stop_codon:yes gene_type:complete
MRKTTIKEEIIIGLFIFVNILLNNFIKINRIEHANVVKNIAL